MVMNEQMLLSIGKICSFQQWKSTSTACDAGWMSMGGIYLRRLSVVLLDGYMTRQCSMCMIVVKMHGTIKMQLQSLMQKEKESHWWLLTLYQLIMAGFGCQTKRNQLESFLAQEKTVKDTSQMKDILSQAEKAIAILSKYYPNKDHFFVYDHATTHLSRAGDALSATKMPQYPRGCQKKIKVTRSIFF